jgi:hypothetical protein
MLMGDVVGCGWEWGGGQYIVRLVVDAPGTLPGGRWTRLVCCQVGGGGVVTVIVVVVVMRWHRNCCSGVCGGMLASPGGWWHG